MCSPLRCVMVRVPPAPRRQLARFPPPPPVQVLAILVPAYEGSPPGVCAATLADVSRALGSCMEVSAQNGGGELTAHGLEPRTFAV